MKLDQVKKNFLKQVLYENKEYQLKECVLWFDSQNKKFRYSLILIDQNQNSTVRVDIEKVNEITEELK